MTASGSTSTGNIAASLSFMASRQPTRAAIHCPVGRDAVGVAIYKTLSYAELEHEVGIVASGLIAYGIGPGVRTALMVRPSIELFVLMFALFRAGAVPVLIDPGIDRRALRQSLNEARPQAFIGVPMAHVGRVLLGWGRDSIQQRITVNGSRLFWGGALYEQIRALGDKHGPVPPAAMAPDALAAILFTSGATGVPKGVEYQHRHFLAQIIAIRAVFRIQPGEIDLPTFPPFALFDPALGMTSVIPDMDPTKPGSADPVKLVNTIEKYGVTTLFGSPALVEVLAHFGASTGKRLGSVKRVISAGAPVTPKTVQRLRTMLPDDAEIFTPYGATECLPVCTIESREILALAERTNRGEGICVGKPLPANQVRLIKVTDEVIDAFGPATEVLPGAIGEIVVCGPTTTEAYFARASATRLAKITQGGRIWHRMGDVGYFDAQGRLWYAGRKAHRVETGNGVFYPEIVEGVFNVHPKVRRTALVGVRVHGKAVPGICVELAQDVSTAEWKRIRFELRDLSLRNEATNVIRHYWRHPGFPVDIRHNAKIDRIALARWALKRADKADLGLT
ncbi:MAG: AMP-binding protein [Xanthomonadales bacterium]|nr:AMP-binding protein [Xanthomonadales bacterium]